MKSGEGVFVVEDLGARSLLSTRFSDNCRLLISSQQLTNTAIFRPAFERPVQGDNEISMAGEFIENVSADQTASAKKTMHPLPLRLPAAITKPADLHKQYPGDIKANQVSISPTVTQADLIDAWCAKMPAIGHPPANQKGHHQVIPAGLQ